MIARGRDRRGHARRGELPAELARRQAPGATGAPRASGSGGSPRSTASNGVARRHRHPHPRLRRLRLRPRHRRVCARLKTFDKAAGDTIGEYELDANDSFTMAVEFSNGALGRHPRHPLGHRPLQRARPASMATRAARGLGQREDLRPRGLPRPRHRDPDLGRRSSSPPSPRNEERFVDRASLRRERPARLPPRDPGAAARRPLLRLRHRRPDAAGAGLLAAPPRPAPDQVGAAARREDPRGRRARARPRRRSAGCRRAPPGRRRAPAAPRPARSAAQALARLQDRQRAEQPARVELGVPVHAPSASPAAARCPRQCDARARVTRPRRRLGSRPERRHGRAHVRHRPLGRLARARARRRGGRAAC